MRFTQLVAISSRVLTARPGDMGRMLARATAEGRDQGRMHGRAGSEGTDQPRMHAPEAHPGAARAVTTALVHCCHLSACFRRRFGL